MANLYPSFVSILFWVGASVFFFFFLVAISPIGKELPQRLRGIVMLALLGLGMTGFGVLTMGNREVRDAERQASEAHADWVRAERDYRELKRNAD